MPVVINISTFFAWIIINIQYIRLASITTALLESCTYSLDLRFINFKAKFSRVKFARQFFSKLTNNEDINWLLIFVLYGSVVLKVIILKYSQQLGRWEKILACLTLLRLWRHQRLTNLPNGFLAGCMLMHRIKLLVRGHKKAAEQQKPFEVSFKWTRPCTCILKNLIYYEGYAKSS